MKINRILAIATILGAALVASCTKDTDKVPTGMSLDNSSLQIYVGQVATLTPVFTPSGNYSLSNIVWTSSDESVASVEGGYVSGLKAGTATITATTPENLKSTCSVTVSNVTASAVTVTPSSLTLYESESGSQVSASVEPYNVTFQTITWSSSDPAVATVDALGNVTPVAVGECDVIATIPDGTKGVCKVKVTLRVPTEPETLEFWKSDAAGYRGLFGAASDNGKSAGDDGWLTYNDGIARWAANTTGKPRKATLELSTGSKLTVTQVDAVDIAGNYYFYNNAFKALSNTKTLGTRQMQTAVQLVAVENPETVNGHVHNLDLVGVYYDFKQPMSLELTDSCAVVYMYFSLDYQTVSTGAEIAVIPELTNSTSYGTGYFAPQTFGPESCNYAWIKWNVSDLFTMPRVTLGSGADRLVSEGMYCCGISCVKKGYATASYTTIYQFNYKNIWVYNADTNSSAYFEKY